MQDISRSKRTGSRILLILALAALMAFTVAVAGAAPDAGSGIDGAAQQMPAKVQGRSYVVIMGLDPAAAYDGGIAGLDATTAQAGANFDATSQAAQDYAAYSLAAQDTVLAAAGVSQSAVTNRYTTALNGFSAIMSESQAKAIAAQPGVAMVQQDTWRQATQDNARDSWLKIDGSGDNWDTGMTGENVLVGVIDTGIWPEHPSFFDDGTYADLGYSFDESVQSACDFGNQAHNIEDFPFDCNNKLVGARQMLNTYRAILGAEAEEYDSARDNSGHGTHTASTAAGNMDVMASILDIDRGLVSGVAPRARVFAYKGLGLVGGFGSDLAAAIDQAVADGVDVINYSVGGGANVDGADALAFLFAEDAGVLAATSAGNSGPGPATMGGPGNVPWITTVGANTQSAARLGRVVLGNGMVYEGISITTGIQEKELVDGALAGSEFCQLGQLNPDMVAGKIVLCKRGAIARQEKSRAVLEAGGVGMIHYEASDSGDLFTDKHWVPAVHVDYTPGAAVKAYAWGQPYANNVMIPVVSGGNGQEVQGTPFTAPTAQIISLIDGEWPYAPNMTAFSSRGPNPPAPDIIKPDITTTGMNVIAGYTPTPDDPNDQPGELFAAISGTSMSSPHVAGLFALMREAYPTLPPAVVKSALMTTANPMVYDNDRTSMANPFGMGAGLADPGHYNVAGSMFQPGLVYYADAVDYLGFLCDAAPHVLPDPDAFCAGLEALGVPTKAYNLNLPSIGAGAVPGSLMLERTVTSIAFTPDTVSYDVVVEQPEGYEVVVTPDSFDIMFGETQTLEIQISNVGAPLGEWRFGSMTLMDVDGVYAARSPIALNGTDIGAPLEIEGAGVDSGAMFDVFFGYTGEYTAAGHGLEPAIVINDNVVQDPDQNFDPEDGFSNAHEFEADGTAFMRFVIPPDGVASQDIDLDMYLYDPNGDRYAISGNGGTDEEIEVVNPMDGTWTLYVHGWQTAGPSADYTLYSWLISATPGGSLVIDAAPAAAVTAETGTVEISWTGATAGQWFLGAVSHSNEDGVIGMTLVNVDNRP